MPAALLPLNSTIVRSMKLLATRARLQVGAVVAPERAVAEAVRLFLTPPRRLVRERDRAFLAGGEGFVVPAGVARLAAWRFGPRERPAVILSHGWGGRGAQWHAFVPALVEAGFQAVVFDHAGHGLSEGRQSSLVDFARGLGAVADAVEPRAAFAVAGVVGHSLGAAAIAPFLRASGRRRSQRAGRPARLARGLLRVVREQAGARREPPAAPAVGDRAPLRRALGASSSCRARVESLRAPALVIHDDADADVRIAAGLAIARAWPGARFVRTTRPGPHRDPARRRRGARRDRFPQGGGRLRAAARARRMVGVPRPRTAL